MSTQPQSHARHARAVLVLGLPLIGGNLAQLAVGFTDTVMLGWYQVETLAAGVIASSYFFVFFIAASGFSNAVLPMVAKSAAIGDETQIRRVTRMGLWLSALWAVILMPFMWWSGPILRILGQTPEIADLAQDYLRIAGWGLIPSLLVMVMKSYLSALERTQVVLWVTILGALANGVANWLLIFGNWGFPELGIRGAALASLVLYVLMLVGLCVYAVLSLPQHELFRRFWRPDWEAFASVYRLGWPIGITLLAEVGLFAASAIMMGWLGTLPLAAHGIALQLATATFMVHIGLSQAATVRSGRAFGARDVGDLLRGAQVAMALSLATVLCTVILFLALPELLMGLFLDPDDPNRAQIIAIGVGLLAVAALFQLADGSQVVVMGLLRGVQDTKSPMVIAALSYWGIGLPAGYVFGFIVGWGAVGIWIGLVLGLTFAAVLMLWRFWVQRRWVKQMQMEPVQAVP